MTLLSSLILWFMHESMYKDKPYYLGRQCTFFLDHCSPVKQSSF